jgi:hypothetical protein
MEKHIALKKIKINLKSEISAQIFSSTAQKSAIIKVLPWFSNI